MTKQIKPRYILTDDDPYFGSCPDCRYKRTVKGYRVINAGKSHWHYCDKHLNAWYTGYGFYTGKDADYTKKGIAKTMRFLEDNYTCIESLTTLESKENKLAMMNAVDGVNVQWCLTVGDGEVTADRRASLDPMPESIQIRCGNNGHYIDDKKTSVLLRRIADALESTPDERAAVTSRKYLIDTVLPDNDCLNVLDKLPF